MQRKREERLKICGAHNFLFSPQTREETGERSVLILLFHFYPYIQIAFMIYYLSCKLQIWRMKQSNAGGDQLKVSFAGESEIVFWFDVGTCSCFDCFACFTSCICFHTQSIPCVLCFISIVFPLPIFFAAGRWTRK